jgi:hypothetical protein
MKVSNKKANLFILTIVIVFVGWIFAYKWDRKTREDFLKTEINDKDYYSLIIKYDYTKGSKQGIDYKNDLKTALKDGIITRGEYQKIVKDEASLSIYEKPENISLYKNSKNKLINTINE